MKIQPCYSIEQGRYLSFEATRATDKKDLKRLADGLTSAGISFGSLSVDGKMIKLSLHVLNFKTAARGTSIFQPDKKVPQYEIVERSSGYWVVDGSNAEGPFDNPKQANDWIAENSPKA